VLTLYSAADLLTGPGCRVCRYADEAADRYLAWFALEAHAEAVTITRLCASLGMCPRHTRRLMGQPGAATRLTAVYRYVLEAARDRLAGRAVPLAACPGCEHDDAAAFLDGRVLCGCPPRDT
jgi:AraC-like DNA-binding protein